MPRLCLVVTLSVAWIAQQTPPPQQQPVFRGGVRTVMVPATVTDEDGLFVRTLEQADFEIRDNGAVQPITDFIRDVQPVTCVLLLDASASMLRSLTPTIGALNEFVVRMLPGDRARFGNFAEDIWFSPSFTGNRDELLEQLKNEFDIRIGRRTRLWDAIDRSVALLAAEPGRRVVIVVTDGLDTWSIKALEDVQSAARKADVAIYAVHFVPGPDHLEGQAVEMRPGKDGSAKGIRDRHGPHALEEFARDSGGGFLDVLENNGWQPPFTAIALDLHSQYVLGFTPTKLDGRLHSLDVRVKKPYVKVRARKTYLAEK